MAKIKYSNAALRDLEQMGDCIANGLKSPAAALAAVSRIQGSIGKMAGFPQMGAPLSMRHEDAGGCRHLACGSHVAFYRELAGDVRIDRILRNKQECVGIMYGNPPEEGSGQTDWPYPGKRIFQGAS